MYIYTAADTAMLQVRTRRWYGTNGGPLAQVRFLSGDLHHKTGFYALQWRKSLPCFHTCATKAVHLRQKALLTQRLQLPDDAGGDALTFTTP